MRIFYAADKSADPRLEVQSNIWRNNLYLTLVDSGHDVVEFDYDLMETVQKADKLRNKRFIARNRPRITNELLRQIREAHADRPIDLFFSYFYDSCVLPEGIDAIRALGITTVNWYCNGSYQFDLVEEISPHYDWCLVPEAFRLKDYEAIGARPIYCQEAANPNIYKPFDVPVEFDVTFIGQAYGERPSYIKYLLENGVSVKVWGYGWEKLSETYRSRARNPLWRLSKNFKEFVRDTYWQDGFRRLLALELIRSGSKIFHEKSAVTLPDKIIGGVLSDSDMVPMYSRSKINLGFSTCGMTHETEERIVQVRLRDFEVPMSGGFYMVEYMEELEEFFDIGKEIVCYSDPQDLVDKIRYYLEQEDQREAIRKAGYERAVRNHTWHKRFEMAFKQMGMDA
jgi:spore maturation protein CgeB